MKALKLNLIITGTVEMEPDHNLNVPFGPVTTIRSFTKMPNPTLVMTDIQKATIGPATALDAANNSVPLAGPLTFTSGDITIITVTPSPDGLSADIVTTGKLGTVQVIVTDGVATFVLDISVVASQEALLSIPVGSPVNK